MEGNAMSHKRKTKKELKDDAEATTSMNEPIASDSMEEELELAEEELSAAQIEDVHEEDSNTEELVEQGTENENVSEDTESEASSTLDTEPATVSIKDLMSEETFNATEQAAKEMVENIKNKTDTPLNIFLEAVRKSKAAKEAQEAKDREEALKNQPTPIDVMDIDELMGAMQNDQIQLCNVSEDITAIQVVQKELKLWGINPSTLGYKIIMSIVEDFSAEKLGHRPTEDEIIENAMHRFNVKKTSITAALSQLVRKAKFDQSVFIPLLQRIPKEELNWNAIVNEIIDFAE